MDPVSAQRRARLFPALPDLLPRVLLVLAFAAAAAAFGAALGPDSRFLAVEASVGLAAIALLDRPRGLGTGAAGLALLLVTVALPESPARGIAVTALLACFGGGLACRRWRREGDLSFGPTLGLALLLQVGFQPERLLPGSLDPAGMARFLGPPLVVAAISRWSARHLSPTGRIVTLLAVLAAARGATVTAAAAVAAPWVPRIAMDGSKAARATLGAATILGLFWRPGVVVAAVFGGAARRRRAWLLAAGLALWGIGTFRGPGESVDALELGLGMLLLLPAVVWPGGRRPGTSVALFAFAVGASRWAGIGGLAVALAVAAAELEREESLPPVGIPWAALAALVCVLPAAYPWFRADPVPDSDATLLGLGCVVLLGIFASLVRFPARRGWIWGLLGAGVWVAVVAALPPPGVELRPGDLPDVVRRADRPWVAEWEGGRIGRVSVQTALSDSAGLPAGSEAGWLELTLAQGRVLRYPLVVGETIGDWAAARGPGLAAPEGWVHWAASGDFFGRRYRVRWTLEPPATGVRRLRVVRREDLPPEVGIIVWKVQAGP